MSCFSSCCGQTISSHVTSLQELQADGGRDWKLKIYSMRKQVKTKRAKRVEISLESREEWSPEWIDLRVRLGTEQTLLAQICSCHCSAGAWVPARTCQKLAVTLIYTEEPCCFLFSPNVPRDKLKSPPCFMSASWDRERVTHPRLVLESWQYFSFMLVLTCLLCLVLRDYLSLFVLFFFLWHSSFGVCCKFFFYKLYLGLVHFASTPPYFFIEEKCA